MMLAVTTILLFLNIHYRLRQQEVAVNKDRILATEFSGEFVELMKNRMVTSFYKYGSIKDGRADAGYPG